eukprot:scaffold286228_cov17-Tisochrysis_lutea.AAC.1
MGQLEQNAPDCARDGICRRRNQSINRFSGSVWTMGQLGLKICNDSHEWLLWTVLTASHPVNLEWKVRMAVVDGAHCVHH